MIHYSLQQIPQHCGQIQKTTNINLANYAQFALMSNLYSWQYVAITFIPIVFTVGYKIMVLALIVIKRWMLGKLNGGVGNANKF